MNVLMLPDSGGRVGFGHVSRLLALGEGLRAHGARVIFHVKDASAKKAVLSRRFAVTTGLQQPRIGVDMALVDSYRFSPSDMRRLRSKVLRVVGLNDFSKPMKGFDREIRFKPGQPILRRPFWKRSAVRIQPRIKSVLITLGGAPNPAVLMKTVIVTRKELPLATIHVAAASHSSVLRRRIPDPHIHWHPWDPHLDRRYSQMDLAITAGGQSSLELMSLGVPVVMLAVSRNQDYQMALAATHGAAISLGGIGQTDWVKRLQSAVRRLSTHVQERRILSRKARQFARGDGALSLAKELLLWTAA